MVNNTLFSWSRAGACWALPEGLCWEGSAEGCPVSQQGMIQAAFTGASPFQGPHELIQPCLAGQHIERPILGSVLKVQTPR